MPTYCSIWTKLISPPGAPAGQADERTNLLQRLGLTEVSRSSSIEIEMTNFEHPPASAGQPGVEYAGSRDGALHALL